MATSSQSLSFAVRAINEANAALKSVQSDIKDVGDKAEEADKKAGGLGSALGGVAKIAGGFIVAQGLLQLPGLIGGISSKATELELQAKKALTVFGDDALGDVKDWANEAAGAMGLTSKQAINLATNMADLLIPMGFSRDAAAELSTETIGLAGALAEWSGGTKSATDVADILTKAFLGETDGLKALGISISAAEVSAALLEKGQNKLTGAALQQAQALVIQELVLAKSTDAQKAFADGSETAARKQAELKAAMAEAKEELATQLMPAVIALQTFLAQYAIPALVGFTEAIAPGINAAVDIVKPAILWLVDTLPILTGVIKDALVGGLLAAVGPVGVLALALYEYRDAVLPAVQAFVQGTKERLQGLADWFRETGIPAATEYATKVGEVLTTLGEWIKTWVDTVAIPTMQRWAAWFQETGIPAIQAFAADAQTELSTWGNWLQTDFLAGTQQTMGGVLAVFRSTVDYVIEKWGQLVTYWETDLKPAFENIKTAVTILAIPWVAAFLAMKIIVEELVTWVHDHWGDIWAVIKPIIDLAVAHLKFFGTVFSELTKLFVDLIGGDFKGAWSDAKAIVEAFRDFFVAFATNWGLVFAGALNLIGEALDSALSTMQTKIEAGMGEIASTITGVLNALITAAYDTSIWIGKAILNGIKDGITSAFDTIKDWLFDQAKALGEAVFGGVKEGMGKLWPFSPSEAGIAIGEGLITGMIKGVENKESALSKTIAGMAAAVSAAVGAAVGAAVSPYGSTQADIDEIMKNQQASLATPSLHTTQDGTPIYSNADHSVYLTGAAAIAAALAAGNPIDAPVKGLPKMGHGGIVTSPTFALIGEEGPEAIVPLSRGGGYGANITINIHAWDSRDVARAIPELARELDRHLKRAGLAGVA